METIFIIGRILFGGFFVIMGMNHFMKLGNMTMYASSKNVPASKLAVIVGGLFLLLGGLGIIFWTYLDIAILLLVIFLIVVSLFMHNFWAIPDPQQKMVEMTNFLKNMAFVGSLLILLSILVF